MTWKQPSRWTVQIEPHGILGWWTPGFECTHGNKSHWKCNYIDIYIYICAWFWVYTGQTKFQWKCYNIHMRLILSTQHKYHSKCYYIHTSLCARFWVYTRNIVNVITFPNMCLTLSIHIKSYCERCYIHSCACFWVYSTQLTAYSIHIHQLSL